MFHLVEQPARRRRLRGVALAAALVVLGGSAYAVYSRLASASDASSEQREILSLPEPTGPHPVGTTSLHLKDASRPDPWVPEATARELMVSLWYPAAAPGERRAEYMTATASDRLLTDSRFNGTPLGVLSTTRTNSFSDAEPAGDSRSLPLVVLAPGFGAPRGTLTALAEDLASHGYVVVGVEHTYESVATTFPDGRVTSCVACDKATATDEPFWEKVGRGRAADVSFVLDELTGPQSTWKGAALIDPSRIAMAGHNVGGASTVDAMVKDARILAGIDIDGITTDTIPASGLSRPFLLLGTRAQQSPGGTNKSWERTWQDLAGWKRWLVVAGAAGQSFTDLAPLADQLGTAYSADMSGVRSLEITRTYVRAFFDLHLRNEPQSLLDGPSPDYAEVRFCSVETRACA